jgi:rare lipoprotein A (peptidoglycan hydrolase)
VPILRFTSSPRGFHVPASSLLALFACWSLLGTLLFSAPLLHSSPLLASGALPAAGANDKEPQVEEGLASWYGGHFHGNRAADGRHYSQYDRTAAHRTLPLGSKVRVTNLENDREVVVRITDRGPVPAERILDLSYAAARRLGMVRQGVARVRLEVLRLGR